MLRLIATGTVFAALAASAGAGPVRPLVSTRLPIEAFAQDGSRIAWMSGGCYTVRIRSLAARRTAIVGNAGVTTCYPVDSPPLALARGRALWVASEYGNNVYANVVTGRSRARNRVIEQVIGSSAGSDGDYVMGVAGDGPTLVYSVVSMSFLDTCIDPGEPCAYFVTGGRVMRVAGDRAQKIPGLPPTLELAASGRRVALVVAAHDAPRGIAASRGDVQVRDAVTGALVSTVTAAGTRILGVGLGPSVLAVASQTKTGYAIESFRAGSGTPLAKLELAAAPTDLGVSGRLVLYRIGRTLRVLDAVTGQARTVAVARSSPSSASIEGRRVAWIESGRKRSAILEAAAG